MIPFIECYRNAGPVLPLLAHADPNGPDNGLRSSAIPSFFTDQVIPVIMAESGSGIAFTVTESSVPAKRTTVPGFVASFLSGGTTVSG